MNRIVKAVAGAVIAAGVFAGGYVAHATDRPAEAATVAQVSPAASCAIVHNSTGQWWLEYTIDNQTSRAKVYRNAEPVKTPKPAYLNVTVPGHTVWSAWYDYGDQRPDIACS
jgi:hypothetical protein